MRQKKISFFCFLNFKKLVKKIIGKDKIWSELKMKEKERKKGREWIGGWVVPVYQPEVGMMSIDRLEEGSVSRNVRFRSINSRRVRYRTIDSIQVRCRTTSDHPDQC